MRELVLHCPEAQAEQLSDVLMDAGALSVSVEDAERDTDAEQPLFGEPGLEPAVNAWRHNRVVALLPEDMDPEAILARVRRDGDVGCAAEQWQLREVPDADWVRQTQAQFKPIRVGRRIWVVPSWHRDDPEVPVPGVSPQEGGSIHVQLDPGLAFGTGSHPTTHLCLEWLEARLQPESTVLDYGCGSGILAIAARMLGAGATRAVDIDRQAVASTRYNAGINGVSLHACLPDELPEGQAQVVVANILSSPLKVLAPMLSARVQPGGWLVLSGILEWQADEVAQAYAPWLPMSVWRAREGWVCLHGRRV